VSGDEQKKKSKPRHRTNNSKDDWPSSSSTNRPCPSHPSRSRGHQNRRTYLAHTRLVRTIPVLITGIEGGVEAYVRTGPGETGKSYGDEGDRIFDVHDNPPHSKVGMERTDRIPVTECTILEDLRRQ